MENVTRVVLREGGSVTHCIVHRFTGGSRSWIEKEVEPEYLRELSGAEALDAAEALRAKMLLFRNCLAAAGVPVPTSYDLTIERRSDNIFLLEKASDCGMDGAEFTSLSRWNAQFFVHAVLDYIRVVARTRGECGLDIQPGNFAVKNGVVSYVDFCPPIIRWADESILQVPNYVEVAAHRALYPLYFEESGLVRVLRMHLTRCFEDLMLENFLMEELELAGFQESIECLARLPEAQVRVCLGKGNTSEARTIIGALSPDEPISLREICLRVGVRTPVIRNLIAFYWRNSIERRIEIFEGARREVLAMLEL